MQLSDEEIVIGERFGIDAVEVVVPGVPFPLSYSLPPELSAVDIGDAVTVEIGRREAHGWVVRRMPIEAAMKALADRGRTEVSEAPLAKPGHGDDQLALFAVESLPRSPLTSAATPKSLKPIRSAAAAFQRTQIELFRWIAEYYGDSLADVIESALPRRVSGKSERYCEITPEGQALIGNSEQQAALLGRARAQAKLLEQINTLGKVALTELFRSAPSARAPLNALEKRALVTILSEEEILLRAARNGEVPPPVSTRRAGPALTAHQSEAVRRLTNMLHEKSFSPALLFGVTGSGKTEVYIQLIEEVLRHGGSALVIVPEIALTPQLFDLFQNRLSTPAALLHSQVLPSARWRSWEQMLHGRIRVAIGARSAVFAPLKDLRLIIVDEEHEGSYKQSDGLRYHGRDVAVMRGKFEQALVVLGSATPSFETLRNVQRKRYQLIELPERATARPLPEIQIVDMNTVRRSEMASENISPQLHEAMVETLATRGQIVILYNRRGFSSYLQCQTCNEVLLCRHCSVPMTVHKGSSRLLCHYCNESIPPPTHCRFCRDPRTSKVEPGPGQSLEEIDALGLLAARGAGTERVVEEIGQLFPDTAIVRLDRDTATHRDSYREILGKMRSGEAQILVGTQMIAKGHDLPGVTLVGIIDADVGLHAPDFRSSERTFQLITQAAGRAGRGEDPGRVIVQTREPDHPTIVATVTNRFTAFARFELDYRKKLSYPPWGKLLRLVISSPDGQDAFHAAHHVRTAVEELLAHRGTPTEEEGAPQLSILGPAPAPHERLRGRYRWHILIKAPSAKMLSVLASQLNAWKNTVREFQDFRLTIDMDPVDML